MRMILGFYYEHIASLENELSIIQSNKKGLEESVIQLKQFLNENGIDEVEAIENKISQLEKNKSSIISQREKAIKGISPNNTHIVDELRKQIRLYISNISELENDIVEITKQIENRIQLREEYFYASIKLKNTNVAKDILKDAEFVSCPQCGNEIQHRKLNSEVCSLCQQPLNNNSNEYIAIENDLIDRRKEIDLSIEKMSNQKNVLIKELDMFNQRKIELDNQLTVEEKVYDSLYLSNIKKFDKQIDEISSEIKYWLKIKVLPMKIIGLISKFDQSQRDEIDKKKRLKQRKRKQTSKQIG